MLIGILLSNGRFTNLGNRLTNLDQKFDTRFDLFLGNFTK